MARTMERSHSEHSRLRCMQPNRISGRRSTTDGTNQEKQSNLSQVNFNKEIRSLIDFQKSMKIYVQRLYNCTSNQITQRLRPRSTSTAKKKNVQPKQQKSKQNAGTSKTAKTRAKCSKRAVKNPKRKNRVPLANTRRRHHSQQEHSQPLPGFTATNANATDIEDAIAMLRVNVVEKPEPQFRLENDSFELASYPFDLKYDSVVEGIAYARHASNTGIVHMLPFTQRKLSKTNRNIIVSSRSSSSLNVS